MSTGKWFRLSSHDSWHLMTLMKQICTVVVATALHGVSLRRATRDACPAVEPLHGKQTQASLPCAEGHGTTRPNSSVAKTTPHLTAQLRCRIWRLGEYNGHGLVLQFCLDGPGHIPKRCLSLRPCTAKHAVSSRPSGTLRKLRHQALGRKDSCSALQHTIHDEWSRRR